MQNMKNHYLIFILLNVFATMPQCLAKLIRVPQDYSTIQIAINESKDGDAIILARGIYAGSIDLKGKGLTLRSDYSGDVPSKEDIEQTVVEGQVDGRPVLTLNGGAVKIVGFTVRGGTAGGIYQTAGTASQLEYMLVQGAKGNGIDTYYGGSMSVDRCVVEKCQGQGIYSFCTQINIRRSEVRQNLQNGVHVYGHCGEKLQIQDSIIRDTVGHGVSNGYSVMGLIVNCTIVNNKGFGVGSGFGVVVRNTILWSNGRQISDGTVDVD